MLVGFAERNNLKIMNTFFDHKVSKKWTWKSPNSETKNEIDFILTDKLNTVRNVAALNKLKSRWELAPHPSHGVKNDVIFLQCLKDHI